MEPGLAIMARGDVLPSEKREYREPSTGVQVVQLTDAPCFNVHPYYNQEGFIDGSERFVFASNRSGIGQIYAVELRSGTIVQLTDSKDPPVLADVQRRAGGGHGSAGLTCDPVRGRIYYSRGARVCCLDVETLREEVVAESPPGCGPLGGPDLSSCGRYLVLGCRPEDASAWPWRADNRYRHGSETLVVLCDLQERRQAVVYHGPSAENRAAADSHLFICRGDPSCLFFGSYTRTQPTGLKTMWFMRVDLERLTPLQDPLPIFDQQPFEMVNHYFPAPGNHVESLLYTFTERDREGVPVGPVRRVEMIDVDLRNRVDRRWVFPGREPVHFKCNSRADLWVGDAADPGLHWFEGRGDPDRYADAGEGEAAEPPESSARPDPAAVGPTGYRWPQAHRWIGLFRTRGPFMEMRPLARHDTVWRCCHPHPVFSPDDRWVAYGAGDRRQSQLFLAESVWPRWMA